MEARSDRLALLLPAASDSEFPDATAAAARGHYSYGPDIATAATNLSHRADVNAASQSQSLSQRQFTTRGLAVGLVVGTLLNAVNVYFGLQTGWISLMSMPAALLSFVVFQAASPLLGRPFLEKENVFVQTVAVAVGCMPLSSAVISVVPAIEKLLHPAEGTPVRLSTPSLVLWSLGLAFFGVIFSVPLRRQLIVREKLRFPSGTATATMIKVLHSGRSQKTQLQFQPRSRRRYREMSRDVDVVVSGEAQGEGTGFRSRRGISPAEAGRSSVANTGDWQAQTRLLSIAFGISAGYTLLTFFVPLLRNLPVFGRAAARDWLWALNPSPAYIGQGMIMGEATTLAMLFGAVVGWGILSPLAKWKGWAPGEVSDWKDGSRGWIVWVSLAIMLADSVVSLSMLAGSTAWPLARRYLRRTRLHRYSRFSRVATDDTEGEEVDCDEEEADECEGQGDEYVDAPPEEQIGARVFVTALVASTALCVGTVWWCFPQVPVYLTVVALGVAFILSVMAARALGQTDLNPVSGISKIAQLFFALIVAKSSSAAVLINLVAGAISEAAGQQAGDILQDLKTSHLLQASPKAQFYGQLIGAAWGAVVSSVLYRVYDRVYAIPSGLFEMPAAVVWVDCARLLYGEGLPAHSQEFCAAFGVAFAVITAVKAGDNKWGRWLPGGIAVAIGMYNTPSFTLARVLGGAAEGWWRRRGRGETGLVLVASGAIIGEGLASLVNLGLTVAFG
ncbi:hypothetical protein Dda_8777 [Drechslerella dactyloides]|uniref:Oligopeptide transporter n=1 Tax=Drechslerella dactyloides TaxID=74499 RepID=A0AAD6IPZ0_DREDA|nr:hypothetical protein Dda_8777 [Drechslerella dactyloides]